MNNPLKNFQAALLSVAFVAVSSTAAFGQLQFPGASEADGRGKNAVAFEVVCTLLCSPTTFNGPAFSIPKGYRLVVPQITSFGASAAPVLEFEGTLSGQNVRHVFQFGRGVTSLESFVVVDSILSGLGTTSPIGGSGTTNLFFSGYLVKM